MRHLTLTLSPIEAEREGADGGPQTLCDAFSLLCEHVAQRDVALSLRLVHDPIPFAQVFDGDDAIAHFQRSEVSIQKSERGATGTQLAVSLSVVQWLLPISH